MNDTSRDNSKEQLIFGSDTERDCLLKLLIGIGKWLVVIEMADSRVEVEEQGTARTRRLVSGQVYTMGYLKSFTGIEMFEWEMI